SLRLARSQPPHELVKRAPKRSPEYPVLGWQPPLGREILRWSWLRRLTRSPTNSWYWRGMVTECLGRPILRSSTLGIPRLSGMSPTLFPAAAMFMVLRRCPRSSRPWPTCGKTRSPRPRSSLRRATSWSYWGRGARGPSPQALTWSCHLHTYSSSATANSSISATTPMPRRPCSPLRIQPPGRQRRSRRYEVELQPTEFIEAPGDRVLTVVHQSFRGRRAASRSPFAGTPRPR